MMSLVSYSLIKLALCLSVAYGQFDSSDGNEAKAGDHTPAPKLAVDRGDFKRISAAKSSRDEELFVNAVSKVLGKDQNNLDALNALAVFYIEKDKPGLAKIILNRALEAHPDEKALHNNLGIVYLTEGEMRRAISSFKKSITLNRSYRIGLVNLGSIYLEFGDYQRALEPLEEGYSLIKGDLRKSGDQSVEIANNYAVALAGVGRGDEAKKIYERILDADSRNIGVLLNYATLLAKTLKQKAEARKAISRLKFVADGPKYNQKAEELDKFLESLPD